MRPALPFWDLGPHAWPRAEGRRGLLPQLNKPRQRKRINWYKNRKHSPALTFPLPLPSAGYSASPALLRLKASVLPLGGLTATLRAGLLPPPPSSSTRAGASRTFLTWTARGSRPPVPATACAFTPHLSPYRTFTGKRRTRGRAFYEAYLTVSGRGRRREGLP